MAVIDIGHGADTLPAGGISAGWTLLDLNNAANDTGTLTSFEIYEPANCTGVKIGTFSGSGTTYTYRDHVLVGNVTGGSKQTFSGVDCDVTTGDWIAFLNGTGDARDSGTGGAGLAYYEADAFSAGSHTYTVAENYWLPIYGTGVTPGWTNITKINGITATDIAKVNGIAVADIVKINGVAV